MPEVALIHKRIDIPVAVLAELFEITARSKPHVARNDIPDSAIAVAVSEAKAIQVILQRSHTLLFIQLGKREVFAHGVGARVPVEADFAPLELFEKANDLGFIAEELQEIDNLERRAKFEAVRL